MHRVRGGGRNHRRDVLQLLGLSTDTPGMTQTKAIRAIALFEALKGAIVLLAASGFLALLHRDVHAFAEKLVQHAHLNPASHYPQIFLDAAAHLQDTRLILLACGAAIYSLIRFAEAYGLYREKAWAEVLAAGSGAIYVPFEIMELLRQTTWHGAVLLVLNILVVALMIHALARRRRASGNSKRGTSTRAS